MTDFATIDDRDAEGHLAATRAQFRHILQPEDATRPGVAGRLARATPVINLLRQFGFGLR